MKRTATLFRLLAALLPFSAAAQQANWTIKEFEPKVFVENKGQFDGRDNKSDSKILFGIEGGMNAYFTAKGLTYFLGKAEKMNAEEKEQFESKYPNISEQEKKEKKNEREFKIVRKAYVSMEWVNANPDAEVVAGNKTSAYINYNDINNSKHSFNYLKGYKKLIYKNLYPNIDVEYVFHPKSGIEYSLILHPGADPSVVKMKYTGAENIFTDKDGNVHLYTACGEITDHAPKTSYQGGAAIASGFSLDNNMISFSLGTYDRNREVIIDPWTNTNFVPVFTPQEVAHDAANNAYVYGYSGTQNQFSGITEYVQKYNSAGALQWTYLINGPNTYWDYFSGDLATDPAGNSYVTCGLSNFNLISEAIKLDPNGNLLWNSGPSPFLYENWRISFNCDYTQLVTTGCGPSCCNDGRGVVINTGTGAQSNMFAPLNNGDLVCSSFGKNGLYYAVSPDDNITWTTHITCLNPGTAFSIVFSITAPFTLSDGGQQTYGPLGFNGVKAGCDYLWVTAGQNLEKRNLNSGALIGQIAIPGGTLRGNAGLDVDKCNNVYVGSAAAVYVYDNNLNAIGNFPTTAVTTDLVIGTGATFYAVGGDPSLNTRFLSQFSMSTNCQFGTTFATTNATCAQGGTATANAIFCSSPYTYAWSNGQTTQTATGLAAGTYTCIVSGAGACNQKDTAVVTITGSGLNCTVTSVNPGCGQNNGTATANPSGGTTPYTYSWNNGQTTQTATGLGAGTYTVVVTDVNNCAQTLTITLNQPSTLSATASAVMPACGQSNGSATVTPSAGSTPYTYSWNNGQTTQTATGLASGTYTVTVTDNSNCTATVAVTLNAPNNMTASASSNNALCGQPNGTATVTPSGGSTPYTYSWNNGQTNQNATGLAAGTYTVTITDQGGCTTTATVQVLNTNATINTTTASTPDQCNQALGSATVTTSGGASPFTYAWSNSQTTQTATGLVAGNYTVFITDANGCTTSTTVAVTNNSVPVTASIAETDMTCSSGCIGTVSVTPTSGNSPYTYNWMPGNYNSPSVTGLCAGTYTVTVTDAGGCTGTYSTTINQLGTQAAANFTLTPVSTTILEPLICFNNLSGNATSFTWYFGDTSNTTSSAQNPPCFMYNDTGTYCVKLVANNSFNCPDSVTICLRIEPDIAIYVPNCFTPNGDNWNNTFYANGVGIDPDNFEMWIFDRWGNMIWHTNKWLDGWDGRANGGKDIAQIDVYVWKIICRDVNGGKHSLIGHVSLIK